jgi:hypothetical protein
MLSRNARVRIGAIEFCISRRLPVAPSTTSDDRSGTFGHIEPVRPAALLSRPGWLIRYVLAPDHRCHARLNPGAQELKKNCIKYDTQPTTLKSGEPIRSDHVEYRRARVVAVLWNHCSDVRGSRRPHHRPHFHAYYQDHAAVFIVDTLECLGGSLPVTQRRPVEAWAEIHRDQLEQDWDLLQSGQPPVKIDPLR